MNQPKKIVQTENGPYVPVSQRLPDFYDKFPPSEGYGNVVDVVDPLSLKPGLLELYKECIRQGVSFRNAGLPELPSWRSLVFVAKLTRNGEVLCKRSTHQEIHFEKDYETAETRASQRLVAACGFDGGALDLDEHAQNERGAVPLEDLDPDPEAAALESDIPDIEAEDDTTDSSVVSIPTPKGSDINPQLQSQIDTRVASLRAQGEDVTPPTTKTEALKFLRKAAGSGGSGS